MNPCALPMGVSALAAAIANRVPDDTELALLAAIFTQLGDTLDTILAQRALCPPQTGGGQGQNGSGQSRDGTGQSAAGPESAPLTQ